MTTRCALAGVLFAAAGTSQAEVIKGISYGPLPLKSQEGISDIVEDDWFCDDAVPMWGSSGRGDLATMRKLGANMVRLYGNNPGKDHTNFLDEAHAQGLSVAPGMSDFPYFQQPERSCLATDFDCFTQVRPLYRQNLENGFLDEQGRYHPALKFMNVINEPDLKIPWDADVSNLTEVRRMCRAIISAFDGMLEAEKDAGVKGPLINFTATFSFAVCKSCEFSSGKPALAQMVQLDDAMRHPGKYGYVPRNNITAAYEDRFTHSFNTGNSAEDLKHLFLDPYELAFPSKPVYIAEYHTPGADQRVDLDLILQYAEGSRLFLGISFFQFQVAYWKAGAEREFGMFQLGDDIVATMPYMSKTYDIYCVQPIDDIPGAVAHVYGGPGVDVATLCAASPGGAAFDQAGYKQIASQDSVQQMAAFVQRVIRHMGASVKDGSAEQLRNFAETYAGDVGDDGFQRMASYIGSRPDWIDFDPQAQCVADRSASPAVLGPAIRWVCEQGEVDCGAAPVECNSTYRLADYVFSRYYNVQEGPWNPLVSCSFGGAAIFAPSALRGEWSGADTCAAGAVTTSTVTTTVSLPDVDATTAAPVATTASLMVSESTSAAAVGTSASTSRPRPADASTSRFLDVTTSPPKDSLSLRSRPLTMTGLLVAVAILACAGREEA